MRRILIAAAGLLCFGPLGAGCGAEEDERPRTLEFIHAAIIQPSCAQATCHSSFAKAEFYDFGSLEGTREGFDGLVDPGDGANSELILILTSPGGEGARLRMPYDAPLPNADVNLIFDWIEDGAEGLE